MNHDNNKMIVNNKIQYFYYLEKVHSMNVSHPSLHYIMHVIYYIIKNTLYVDCM